MLCAHERTRLHPVRTDRSARRDHRSRSARRWLSARSLFLCLFVALVVALWRSATARAVAAAEAADHARDAEARMAGILQAQAEMQGRIGAIAEVFGARQAELNAVDRPAARRHDRPHRPDHDRADASRRMKASRKLQERLAVIDTAQNNIQSLAGQVVQLQAILSNKQTRGAFGQSRMEAIVADGLPHGAYEFQATLSNGSRPDCLVRMPNGAPTLVIDAKFPLEAWNAIRARRRDGRRRAEDTPRRRSAATSRCTSRRSRRNT